MINFQRQSVKTGRTRGNRTNVLLLEAVDENSWGIAFHRNSVQLRPSKAGLWDATSHVQCLHTVSVLRYLVILRVSDL